jgi:hypothetical protein
MYMYIFRLQVSIALAEIYFSVSEKQILVEDSGRFS